jgi:hypothetical protein
MSVLSVILPNQKLVGNLGDRINADPWPGPTFEFHHAIDQRENGVISSKADIEPGVKLRAPLPDQYATGCDPFSAEGLDTEVLWIAVSTVTGRSAALFCGHPNSSDLLIALLGRDNLSDAHLREPLAMTFRAPIIFPAFFLKHRYRPSTALTEDFSRDPRAVDPGMTDHEISIALNQSDLLQFDDSTNFTRQFL